MLFEIVVSFLVENVSIGVFEFFFRFDVKLRIFTFHAELMMQCEGVLDGGDLLEMYRVRDFQAFHAISVSPFREMFLECTSSPVAEITTDFTFILDS